MKRCKVCNKECNTLRKGLCRKHYEQLRKNGCCLDNNPRTKYDSNEIVLYENYAEIILYNKNYYECARAIIDLDDVEKIKKHKWYLNDNGYVLTHIDKKNVRLHRFIKNCFDNNIIIDHKNGNKLDNRKDNLRECTSQQNSMNHKTSCNNTSGFDGVCWDKEKNKWKASIKVNYKGIHLGYFNDKEEAIKVRKEAEIKYFGEYRRDNSRL